MVGVVQKHQTPHAVCVFQHVDAGVVLFDVPEAVHTKTQNIADNGFVEDVYKRQVLR